MLVATVGDPHSTVPKAGEPVDSEGAQKCVARELKVLPPFLSQVALHPGTIMFSLENTVL